MKVAVIGASNKPQRYSYQAIMLLKEKGHEVYPVHPKIRDIEGQRVYASMKDIDAPVDTVTLYVNSHISGAMQEGIFSKTPGRIIFNPGAENPELEKEAIRRGVIAVNACTLVMLKTGQF